MNLVLLRDDEVTGEDHAVIRGRRARHLLDVVGCRAGDSLRVGRPDGPRGIAEVVGVSAHDVTLKFELAGEPPPRPLTDLILAMPRPKALRRLVEHAVAMGVGRLLITNSVRVDKSYFQTNLLAPEALESMVWAGLEQAGDTRLPEILVFKRLKPFVEDELDALLGPGKRLTAHPQATSELAAVAFEDRERCAVAIGPEGGFIPYEIELLGRCGFVPVTLGERILRVETACTAVMAQLDLIRRRG